MQIQFTLESPNTVACDLLAVGAGDDLDADLADLDALFDGHLLAWARERKFDGSAGSTLVVPTMGRTKAKALCLVGTGKGRPADVREAAAMAGREARKLNATQLALSLGDALDDHEVLTALESVGVGNYEYDAHKPETERHPPVQRLVLIGAEENEANLGHAKTANVRIRRQNATRDWVNMPPADLHPQSLADAARAMADIPNVTVEVWDIDRCIAENCVGIEAVGRGSSRKGCLIHLTYRPPGATAHVALVGKGVTFDSGGLSLKPSASMLTMRCDMGGGATALGAFATASELGLNVNLDCFVGAVENLTGSEAYKLGDILHYANGVTVEVHNTDAEGRLVLADCLIQACKTPGVTTVVDLATLTGAAVVALGPELAGLFTRDDELAAEISAASEATGEGLWRLPMKASYKKMLKGEYGQIKNVGGREGGAITAALFLEHFVHGVRWAHLDIAASAFYDKATGPYAAGATGQGVRSLTTWLEGVARRG